jgi:putative DNA primase/helicase
MALTIDQAKAVITDFCNTYPATLSIGYRVRNTQQEAFNDPRNTKEVGTIYGAYFPRRRLVAIAAASHSVPGQLVETLRHELLGHFGINTCSRVEKRAILNSIIAGRYDPRIAKTWEQVVLNYPNLDTDLRRAEEVYCTVCEKILPDRRQDLNLGARVFRDVTRNPTRSLSFDKLVIVTAYVAEGLHTGTHSLQIIPATDDDQFRATEPEFGM